jgi:hypothetical protein
VANAPVKLLQACRKQLGSNRFFWILNGLCVLLFLLLLIYVRYTDQGSGSRVQVVSRLFREPFNFAYPYIGLLTSLSEVLWCISASICLFSFSITKIASPRQRNNWFLLLSAIALIILLVDDIFRLTLMTTFYLGVPKLAMYAAYGTFFIFYTFMFSKRISKTPYLLLLISLVLFALSGMTDIIHLEGRGAPIILEDGTKLLGLLNLALYFWQVSQQEIMASIRHRIQNNLESSDKIPS